MAKEIFIQVGVTALRSPLGDPLPSVPLYIKADQLKPSGLTQAEEDAIHSVSGVIAEVHERNAKKEAKNVKIQKNNAQ